MHRFRDTEIWQEDWYCELGGEYQKLWDFICDKCDNAGVWKPNKIDFETKTKFKVSLDSFFKKVNGDKERIMLLDNGRWFLPGFIKYQWFNKKDTFSFNLGNKLHISFCKILIANGIELTKVRGLIEVLERSRERDNTIKEEIINTYVSNIVETSSRPLQDLLNPELPETPPPRPVHAPQLQHVIEFFHLQGKDGAQGIKEAERFFNYYEGLGWKKGITPIASWRSFALSWISNPLPQNQTNGNKTGSKSGSTAVIPDDKPYTPF